MWIYSDYITYEESSPSTFRERLRLHIVEVSNKISADVSANSYSRQSHPLNELHKSLLEQLKEARSSAATGGGMAYGRFRAPR